MKSSITAVVALFEQMQRRQTQGTALTADTLAIVARIERLQRQFQTVADQHPLVCLHDPHSCPSGFPYPFAGEERSGRVELPPPDSPLRAVTDHVDELIRQATELLKDALPHVAPYYGEDLTEFQARSIDLFLEAGWMRWLEYTTAKSRPWVVNYPQVAVSALSVLLHRCAATPSHPIATEPRAPSAGGAGGVPEPDRGGKGMNINARMLDILSKSTDAYYWTAEQFASHLGCKAGTVKQTKAWGQIIAYRAIRAAERVQQTGALAGGRQPKRK